MENRMKTDKLADLARHIDGYLQKFEADKKINKPHNGKDGGTTPYWRAGACVAGRYVSVQYVSYQGQSNLTKEQARIYLDWLHAGNVGKHWTALEAAQ